MEKKEQKTVKKVDATGMNIFTRLAHMRVDLQNRQLIKSGKNTHSNYEYYELSDFLPACNEIARDYDTVLIFEQKDQTAILNLINCEDCNEKISFSLPVANINVPGASAMQNIGAVTTYARRYLYMIAFEISETDMLDTTEAEEKRVKAEEKRRKEEQERKALEEKKLEMARTPIDKIKISMINNEMVRTGISESAICKRMMVNSISEITEGQFGQLMKDLKATPSLPPFNPGA